jgi:hypothetical protein
MVEFWIMKNILIGKLFEQNLKIDTIKNLADFEIFEIDEI